MATDVFVGACLRSDRLGDKHLAGPNDQRSATSRAPRRVLPGRSVCAAGSLQRWFGAFSPLSLRCAVGAVQLRTVRRSEVPALALTSDGREELGLAARGDSLRFNPNTTQSATGGRRRRGGVNRQYTSVSSPASSPTLTSISGPKIDSISPRSNRPPRPQATGQKPCSISHRFTASAGTGERSAPVTGTASTIRTGMP